MPYDPHTPTLEALETRRLLAASPVLGDRTVPDGFAVTVNFQPANLGSVENTRADFGRPFGERGNGLTYGWSRDLEAAGDVVDRDSDRDVIGLTGPGATVGNGPEGENQDVDERYDTIATVDPGDEWMIEVPDASATYAVAVIAGDPDLSGGIDSAAAPWSVNGTPVLVGRPFEAFPYAEAYAYVTPDNDGRIRITAGAASDENALAWVRVAEVEPLPEAEAGAAINWAASDEPMSPVKRAEGGTARVGDDIYIVGGFPEGYTSSYERVDVLDVASGEFESGPPLPDDAARDHAAIASDDAAVYWISGHLETGSPTTADEPASGVVLTPSAWRLDVATQEWERLPDLPEGRAAASAVVVGERLYVFGGTDETDIVAQPDHWSLDLSRLGEAGLAWDAMPPMPVAADHATAGAFEGLGEAGGPIIVVAGGEYAHMVSYATLETTQVYDVNTATWRMGRPMPVQISHANSAVTGDRLWLVGGQQQAQQVTPNVLSYDPADDVWYRHTDLPERRKVGGLFIETDDSSPTRLFYLAGDQFQDFWSQQTLIGEIEEDEEELPVT